MRVSILDAIVAASNPEPNSHLSLVNAVTVTFNMAVTVKVAAVVGVHVVQTLNRSTGAALGAIKGEIQRLQQWPQLH